MEGTRGEMRKKVRWILLPSREKGELFGWRGDEVGRSEIDFTGIIDCICSCIGYRKQWGERGKSKEYIVFEWTWVDGGATPEMGKTGEEQ